jgi:hypothetical protein
VNTYLSLLGTILDAAVDDDYLARSPLLRVIAPTKTVQAFLAHRVLVGGGAYDRIFTRRAALEWPGLPLRLFAPAQPRLGRRPAGPTVLAGEHDPIPGLDDMAEGPQVAGGSRRVQGLVQFLLELAAVGVGQGGANQLDPLRQVGAGRSLGHAHRMPPSVHRTSFRHCDTTPLANHASRAVDTCHQEVQGAARTTPEAWRAAIRIGSQTGENGGA